MDEYIKREDLISTICMGCNEEFSEEPCEPDCCAIRRAIKNIPTADVVPKSEVDNLEYTLCGVMHFVDKWLEGAELEQNEVNRAFLMRAKTLLTIEKLQHEVLEYEETTGLKQAKQDVARKIFAEIKEAIEYAEIEWGTIFGVKCCIANVEKKYTEGGNN